jgi:iron(II)-dependent oxidoreductase
MPMPAYPPLWPQNWTGAGNSLFAAPAPNGHHADWLKSLLGWRTATRSAAGLTADGDVYKVDALTWTQTSYIQPQVHTFDRMLWDETSANYTVDRYLDDCLRRYGGIDSVLLWPTYPNLGIDEKNQFDLIRLAKLEGAIADFHARGVHVLLPYNPWDFATRREGQPDAQVLAELSVQISADGFNGDTIQRVARTFWEAGTAAGRPLAIEPEGGGYPDTNTSADASQWNASGWSSLG